MRGAMGTITLTASQLAHADLDGDGTVTVSDALLAMRYAMGTVTNINVNAADVDGDGNVTITDAVTILRMAMTA